MAGSLWQNLKKMVEIDQQIKQYEEKIEHVQNIITQDQEKIPHLQEQVKQKEDELKQAQKMVDQHELANDDLKNKETEKQKTLEHTTNQKTYEAITKELEVIHQNQSEIEDQLVKAWHHLETIKTALEKQKEESATQINAIHESIKIQQESFTAFQDHKEELEQKRTEQTKFIPHEWLSAYERMKKSVPDPIVPVVQSVCSACFYAITYQDLAKLKRGGVVPCRNCYRFLYYVEPQAPESNA